MLEIFTQLSRPTKVVAIVLGTALILPACANISTQDLKPIKIDGSSTVAPITDKVLEDFKAKNSSHERDGSVNSSFVYLC
ncbi:hypothetical protein [Microcystis aeruginosa]|uniref:Uncharacterized protein n=1 Tax=Microcystis aeruginosa NIES-2521 TaxID=2303983 RepID=A0A5A5S2W6_MICAE|nr:hypothetical protein MiTs_03667 [Microcystis aeruginosa NIES-2521]